MAGGGRGGEGGWNRVAYWLRPALRPTGECLTTAVSNNVPNSKYGFHYTRAVLYLSATVCYLAL